MTVGRATSIVEQMKYKKVCGVSTKDWPPTLPIALESPEHPNHRRAILVIETMLEQPEMSYEKEEHGGLDYVEFLRQRVNHKIMDQNISAIPSPDLLFLTKQKLRDISINMKKEPEMKPAMDVPAPEKTTENKIEHEPSR